MIDTENALLKEVALHRVGNQLNEGSIHMSKDSLMLTASLNDLLLKFFTRAFQTGEYYNLFHEDNIDNNLVYSSASILFDDKQQLFNQSLIIAQHLFDKTNHPKIKDGELYVAYIENMIIDGEEVDAIGIFKSESKDTFLQIHLVDDKYSIEPLEGINTNRIDKGCLIFNTQKDKGYIVAIVDNISKAGEARFWRDDFLHIRQHQNDYFHTQQVMKVYKDFVTEKLPDTFNVDKADQAQFLNKSISFFKEKDDFTMEEFKQEVIAQPQIIETFNDFISEYEKENQTELQDAFKIEENAVKKQSRVYKSVIKLDKNFHIYVHGNRDRIVKGYDESTGMHFYQLFFKEEA